MNRKLLVTLLRKDIQELDMITEGFMEMNEYPKAIISLAQRKADDIQSYIKQLAEIKAESTTIAEVIIPSEIEIAEFKTESNTLTADAITTPIAQQSIEEDMDTVVTLEEIQNMEETFELIQQEETTVAEPIEFSIELQDEQPVIQEVTETPPTQEEAKPTEVEFRRTVLSERDANATQSWNEAHSRTDNSRGAILANKKIDDIKQAMNIGDRFRFQRELFKGNGEDMNKTLNYINQLATLVEVQAFLQSKYNWAEGNESAEDFYQIVKRRFI